MLNILDEDVSLSLLKANEKALALKLKDKSVDVHFMLTDTSVIEKAPTLKQVPEFELKLDISSEFMNKFVAAKSALPDVGTFTILTADNQADLVIGYSSINTNRITIPADVSQYADIKRISFNADLFKDVIQANKECKSAVLEISSAGMAKIDFDVDGYHSKYWLVAVENAS
jgi:hypothetical protein